MSLLRTISPHDRSAAGEVVECAYQLLHDMELTELATPQVKTPEVIGVSGVCVEVSDAVTRAAHKLGILASREGHAGHFFTSFSPLDSPPDEEDPILCLTWGQFQPGTYEKQPGEFFGKRRDICPYVGGYYGEAYASWSTLFRQITHTPSSHPRSEHVWLETTPEDIANRTFPVGQVVRSAFPDIMWEPQVALSTLV